MVSVSALNRFALSMLAIFAWSCSSDKEKDREPEPPTLNGVVLSAEDSSPVEGANVVVIDLNTNATVARQLTGINGEYSVELDEGSYTVEIQASGYYDYPANAGGGMVVTLPSDSLWTITLIENPNLGPVGTIQGQIDINSGDVSGTLVVASNGNHAVSTAAGPDGSYILYNLAPGAWTLEFYKAGLMLDGTLEAIQVEDGKASTQNVNMLSHRGTKVSGSVSFLSTTGKTVDVTLVHPITRKAIPGLSVMIDSSKNFELSAVPPGEYIAWASFQNDSIVMDPDWIRKSGLPELTVTEADTALEINFSCTGAITLTSPTNPMDSLYGVQIDSMPVFTWIKQSSYSSASEYILELFDDHGNRVWGGFDAELTPLHATIPEAGNMSIAYNFDGSAELDTLPPGQYRWKVYAVKVIDKKGVITRELLSASEDLLGLFEIVPQ